MRGGRRRRRGAAQSLTFAPPSLAGGGAGSDEVSVQLILAIVFRSTPVTVSSRES